MENVPGLLTSNEGRDFGTIIGGLAELGYGVAWRILDAQHFGLAQRRERVFIVGHLGDFAAVEVLLEPESLSGNPAAGSAAGEAVAPTISGGSAGGTSHGKPSGTDRGPLVTAPLGGATQTGGYRTTDLDHGAFVVDARGNGPGDISNTLTGDHMDRITDYTPVVAVPLRSRSAPASNTPGRGGEDHENLVSYWDGGQVADTLDASQIAKGQMMPERRRFPVVFEARLARNGRGGPEPIVPPLKAESGRTGKGDSAPLVAGGGGAAVRRLTPLECERLQGFPDGWTEGHSDSARYRMLGNAVAVPVAEWIGRRILQLEEPC